MTTQTTPTVFLSKQQAISAPLALMATHGFPQKMFAMHCA